jgi:phosphatidylglycerophosphate synthase
VVELVILLFVVLAVACFGLLLPFLRLAVVIILAASCLMTFALCRAATRRDMLEARWREERAGSVSEESHESA